MTDHSDLAKALEVSIFRTEDLIPGKNLKIYDVALPERGGHIHTVEAGWGENKPKLLLLHGYGGSSLVFWKMMAKLKDKYHVYAIDQYGTGQSSRPDFYHFEFDNTVDFFCGAIKEWRNIVGLNKYSYLGHSLGGYTAVQDLRTNPDQRPDKLFLLSPAGFTSKTKEEINDMLESYTQMTLSKKMVAFGIFYLLHDWNLSAFDVMKLVGKKRILKKYYNNSRFELAPELADKFGEYFHYVTEGKTSGDRAIGVFTYYGRYSTRPLGPMLFSMQEKGVLPETTVYYGEKDWMDKEDTKKFIENYGLKVRYIELEGVGHQMPFNSPDQLIKDIESQL